LRKKLDVSGCRPLRTGTRAPAHSPERAAGRLSGPPAACRRGHERSRNRNCRCPALPLGRNTATEQAARIHTKIIRRLPLEIGRHGNWRGGDAPLTIRPPGSYIRRRLVHQPRVRFRRRGFQLGHHRSVGLELLALLDAERQEHTHHLEVAGLHWLFVQPVLAGGMSLPMGRGALAVITHLRADE
jgi:hypothetical protein